MQLENFLPEQQARRLRGQETMARLTTRSKPPPSYLHCPVCGTPRTCGERLYCTSSGAPAGCDDCIHVSFI